MRILVLGGTQFIGRHIVEELLRREHSLSLFNRGVSKDELDAEVERRRGDRDEGASGLEALAKGTWDVCIDVSGYTPRQVRASAELLHGRVRHYVFISAVSVYGDPVSGPVDENHARTEPAAESVTDVVGEMYGRLKVTCENIVRELFAERSTLLRPQIVAGPYDSFDRFSYWVRRPTQGGRMLMPGDGSDFLQVIDAGDVARFTRIVCEKQIGGVFNLAGPRLMWRDFAALLGAKEIVWVPPDVFATAGVSELELPLYRPTAGPRSSLMHVSSECAGNAGLTLSETSDTISRVRDWLPKSNLPPALSPEREAELIAMSQSLEW